MYSGYVAVSRFLQNRDLCLHVDKVEEPKFETGLFADWDDLVTGVVDCPKLVDSVDADDKENSKDVVHEESEESGNSCSVPTAILNQLILLPQQYPS